MTQPETYTQNFNEMVVYKNGKMFRVCLCGHFPQPGGTTAESLYKLEPIEDNPMPEIRLGDWIGHVDEYGLWREGVICYMKENRIDFADKNQINICFLRNGIRTIRRAGQELWEAKK